MIYLDAGTTYSKIITDSPDFEDEYLFSKKENKYYYVLPSSVVKSLNIVPTRSCGHMANANENEIIALAKGAKKLKKSKKQKKLPFLI